MGFAISLCADDDGYVLLWCPKKNLIVSHRNYPSNKAFNNHLEKSGDHHIITNDWRKS